MAPGEPGLIATAVFLLCLPTVPKNNTTPRLWLCAGIYCIYFPRRKEAKVGGKKEGEPAVAQHVGNIKRDNESAFMKPKNREWFMLAWCKRFFGNDYLTWNKWKMVWRDAGCQLSGELWKCFTAERFLVTASLSGHFFFFFVCVDLLDNKALKHSHEREKKEVGISFLGWLHRGWSWKRQTKCSASSEL